MIPAGTDICGTYRYSGEKTSEPSISILSQVSRSIIELQIVEESNSCTYIFMTVPTID